MSQRLTASDTRRLIALGLTMLLPSLGTSIANVALPTLRTAFSASQTDVQWVVLGYLLSVTTLIVGVGRLGDIFGRRRILQIGIAVFGVASVGAALSSSLWLLVAARALQGVGAAAMMSLAVASVADIMPRERTGTAMGLLGTISAIGTALGPSLGGALVFWFGWQAVFAVMAMLAGVTFIVATLVLPTGSQAERGSASFDIVGMVLLALFLAGYALLATMGFSGDPVLGISLATGAALALVAFIMVERRVSSPLVQLKTLIEGDLGPNLVALGLVSTIMMATLVVGPFYLSESLGLSPVEAGLVMSIGPGVAALVGLPAGRLVDAYGVNRVTAAGLLGVVLGTLLLAILPNWVGTLGYVAGLVSTTAGYALFQAANNTGAMSGVASERKGVTSALLGLARNLGLITGASAMGAVFATASSGVPFLALGQGPETGLLMTFGVAFVLAVSALCVVGLGRDRRQHPWPRWRYPRSG